MLRENSEGNSSSQRRGTPGQKDLRSRSVQQRRRARYEDPGVNCRSQYQEDPLRRGRNRLPGRASTKAILVSDRFGRRHCGAGIRVCGPANAQDIKGASALASNRLRPAPGQNQRLKRQHLRERQTEQQLASRTSISHSAAMPCPARHVHHPRRWCGSKMATRRSVSRSSSS